MLLLGINMVMVGSGTDLLIPCGSESRLYYASSASLASSIFRKPDQLMAVKLYAFAEAAGKELACRITRDFFRRSLGDRSW